MKNPSENSKYNGKRNDEDDIERNNDDDYKNLRKQILEKKFKTIYTVPSYFINKIDSMKLNELLDILCLSPECQFDIVLISGIDTEGQGLINVWKNPKQYFGSEFGLTDEEIQKNILQVYHKKGSLLVFDFFFGNIAGPLKIQQFTQQMPYFDGIQTLLAKVLDSNFIDEFLSKFLRQFKNRYLLAFTTTVNVNISYTPLLEHIQDISWIEYTADVELGNDYFSSICYQAPLLLNLPSQKLIPKILVKQSIYHSLNPKDVAECYKQASEKNMTFGGFSIVFPVFNKYQEVKQFLNELNEEINK